MRLIKRKDCPMRHENGNCTVLGGFCTAVNDQICEALHNAYDCGWTDCALKVRKMEKCNTSKPSQWKYYHKQGKAVCMNCSFERNLDDNFGRAVSCPNCGARMDGDSK